MTLVVKDEDRTATRGAMQVWSRITSRWPCCRDKTSDLIESYLTNNLLHGLTCESKQGACTCCMVLGLQFTERTGIGATGIDLEPKG